MVRLDKVSEVNSATPLPDLLVSLHCLDLDKFDRWAMGLFLVRGMVVIIVILVVVRFRKQESPVHRTRLNIDFANQRILHCLVIFFKGNSVFCKRD